MAKTVTTGIVLSADIKSLKKGISGAKQVLGGFRKALKGAGKGASGMGAAYKSSIDTIFKSVEVFKSLQGLITDVFGSFVAASMDMRKENDKQKQDIKALQNSFKGLQAMLGDFILPLILGVADAVKPLIKSFKTWLKVNKDLVSGKLVEYLTTVATTLTSGIAQAVITVMRIWNGWSMLIDSTQAMFQGFFASALQGFAYLREGAAKFYEAIGQEKMAKSLTDGAQAFRDYADSFQDASDQNIAEAAKTVKELEELEKQVRKVETAIKTGIGQAGASAMKRFKQDIKKRAANWEELAAKKKELAEKAKKEKEARDKLLAAAAKKAADEERKRLEAQKAMHFEIGSIIGSGAVDAMKAFAAGTKTAGEAMRDLVVQTAAAIAKALLLNAIKSGVASGALGAVTGGIGAAVGGGLLSAATSLLFNSGGYVPGFASGGGVDSIAARLTPGEFVLPKGLVDSIRLGKAPPKASYANGGMVAAGAAAGPAAVNVQMQTFAGPSRGEFRRWYKSSVAPNVRSMGKRGQL